MPRMTQEDYNAIVKDWKDFFDMCYRVHPFDGAEWWKDRVRRYLCALLTMIDNAREEGVTVEAYLRRKDQWFEEMRATYGKTEEKADGE